MIIRLKISLNLRLTGLLVNIKSPIKKHHPLTIVMCNSTPIMDKAGQE